MWPDGKLQHTGFVFIAMLASALPVAGQTALAPSIESEGAATLETAPDYAEFALVHSLAAPSLTDATQAVLQFDTRLRDALKEQEVSPVEIEVGEPAFVSKSGKVGPAKQEVKRTEVQVRARLRFSAADFGRDDAAVAAFAALFDKLHTIAQGLRCSVEGPKFGMFDPLATEQSAIGKAIESAYPLAQAAAQIMPGRIVAVQSVNIKEVTWNTDVSGSIAGPSLKRLKCSARVRVTYAFTTGG